MKKQSRLENILYLAIWTVLFLVPVIMLYIQSAKNSQDFNWSELWMIWRQFGLFFGIFLLHNFVLAPMLVFRQRRWHYFSAVVVLVLVFSVVQCMSRPHLPNDRPGPPKTELKEHRPPTELNEHRPPQDKPMGPPEGRIHEPPILIGQHDVIAVIILILMLGMNIGVKLYFRQRNDQQRLHDLERENLEQQLEYLKYQINPHFLMNTLNNIHALVDIDQEQAKESIVELSKIMRFVLYDGSKQKVPLGRELQFLENYIQLMRMRVTDKVSIHVTMPEMIPDYEIPPLMLITFVENAFKHGVSYQQPSFINISINIEGRQLFFHCENSKISQAEDKYGGVGLANAKRRLELIYGNQFTLNINDADTYQVDLIIPL